MAEKAKVLRAGVGLTIGNYLLKGVVFLTAPIFARLMTTADYGVYNVFVSYESIFFVILGLAIHSSYKNAYYKFRDPDHPESELGYQKYISVTICFLFASLAFWLGAALVFRRPLAGLLGIEQPLLYILVIGSFIDTVTNCYSTDKGIHYQYKELLIVSFVGTVLGIALSILLMKTVCADRMVLGRILGSTVPGVCIYLAIALRYVFRASPRGMGKALAWGIRYSLPIVPHGISQMILSQFDRIMILRMIGESEAGIYSFAYILYSMVAITANSVDGVWSPWFYEKREKEDRNAIHRGSSLFILIMLLASVGVVMLCPELIRILGGKKYEAAIACAVPIVCAGFFSGIYNIPCLVEYYHEKTGLIAVSTAAAAVLNIILNAVFIPRFGYAAASYTTLFTYMVYFLAHYLLAKKIEGKSLFPTKLILLSTLLLFAAAGIALANVGRFGVRFAFLALSVLLTLLFEERSLHFIHDRLKTRGEDTGSKGGRT